MIMDKQPQWWVYCNGHEFGINYSSLFAAQCAAQGFRVCWPMNNFYVRKKGSGEPANTKETRQ